jgi:hypothetical protein
MKDLGQAIPDSHDEVTDEPSPSKKEDWAPGSVHSWKVLFYQSAVTESCI